LLDFVYDDIEEMNRELNRWRKAYTEYSERLEQERSSTEAMMEPLTLQLQEVEAQVQEQQRKVNKQTTQREKHTQRATSQHNWLTIQTNLNESFGCF
jgi:hypothetical protein